MRGHGLAALALLALGGSACAQALPSASSVQALPAASSTQDKDGHLRVQVSARQQTTLSAELAAKIAFLPYREGDAFHIGQALVSFDCSIFRAQLNKAQAQAEAARQTLKVNRRLAQLNSISTLEVDQAEAKVKETEAEAGAMRATVSHCTLAAPFSGRVAKLHVENYQYVPQGKPLLDIVDTSRLEVKLIVPSRWLAWLAKGTRFAIHVDDLNRDYQAKVIRLGARIDPVSQSVGLIGEIEGSPAELLPGMSGWASFKPPK
jgi:RND family efflux transporter MFP subunit